MRKQQETQIEREIKLEKEKRLLDLSRAQQAQQLEIEHQEIKLKQEKQFQAHQEAIKREQFKKQMIESKSNQHLQGILI